MEDWTYSGNPASSTLDTVRFLVGDTVEAVGLVTDSEVTWALSEESNVYYAAALVCETIAALKAQEPDMSVGDLKITGSQVSSQYEKKAAKLRAQGLRSRGVSIYAGGTSVARKDTVEDDTDRVEPFFRRDDHVNPSAAREWSTQKPSA